ncbi:MAG: Fe-S cluster assembly protein SufD [marine bacterium B5-7]|nr:MAG: Fe-S cluster assembly protein SufD [marine bacterium B5-7]
MSTPFSEIKLPTRRDEAWKYTDLSALSTLTIDETRPASSAKQCIANCKLPNESQLVFINGKLSSAHSVIQGFSLDTVELAEKQATGLDALLLTEQLHLSILPETKMDAPIHLVFVTTDQQVSNPKLTIALAPHTTACFIEHYMGEGKYFSQSHLHFQVGEQAKLTLTRNIFENKLAFHRDRLTISLEKNANSTAFFETKGTSLSRSEITVDCLGTGANSELIGLFRASEQQQADIQTTTHHRASNTTSNQRIKSVIDDKARGIFNGSIHVPENVGVIQADMSNKNLLLSNSAEMNTKPQLEIYADDVKCSHGATIGQLDESALFFLQSRGITRDNARNMLQQAFINDILREKP